MGYSKKHRAAALAADCKPSELGLSQWDRYGLEVYSTGGTYGREYAVGTDDEAEQAARDYIENTLWAFNADFLAGQTDLPVEVFTALQGKYEDSNDTLRTLIERSDDGLDGFVDEAISADGRGHFLSGYDGRENEIEVGGKTFYVYAQ